MKLSSQITRFMNCITLNQIVYRNVFLKNSFLIGRLSHISSRKGSEMALINFVAYIIKGMQL